MAQKPKNILILLEKCIRDNDTPGKKEMTVPIVECRMIADAIREIRDEVQNLHAAFQGDSDGSR